MLIRNILLTLWAGVMLTSCHALYTYWPTTPKTDFEYICQEIEVMFEVGCGTLEAPTVVYSSIIDDAAGWRRWHGVYYHGEPYIFINPTSPDSLKHEILLHEMTHYVLYELELIEGNETCEHERIARLISGGTWTDSDKGSYGCVNRGI